jgi:hypothetical protein
MACSRKFVVHVLYFWGFGAIGSMDNPCETSQMQQDLFGSAPSKAANGAM